MVAKDAISHEDPMSQPRCMDRFDRTKLFLAGVEAGSFSKPARLTGIAQSTASKQVAELEKRIGAHRAGSHSPLRASIIMTTLCDCPTDSRYLRMR